MAKNVRPALLAPDLTGIPGRPPSLPMSANDPRFAAAEALESESGISRRVQEGSVRVINTETAGASQQRSELPSPPVRRRGPELSLSTKVPDYVMQQLRIRSAEKGITIRNLLLIALQKEGFEIDEEDIQDERKRR